MAANSFRNLAVAMSIVLMSAVVSAQGNSPGVRPDPTMPSSQTPRALTNVSFEQRLNEQLPLDLPFKDEAGRTSSLANIFGRKPVVLTFVYYDCPMLCTQVFNGLESALRVIHETVGKEFDVVTVSFDPKETPVLAAGKKKAYLERYKRPAAEQGWHFLTGDKASIDALTKAAGFNYSWDEASHQFAHASGIIVATPAGKVSRYFMGIELFASRRQVRADRIVEREDRHAWPSGCCSIAITTIRPRVITASWRCGRCGSAAG